MSERKGKVIVRSGKGRHYREVPLNLDARRARQEYLVERPDLEDPHVFIGQRGNGLTDAAIQDVLKKYAHLAGVEVSPHLLRHTFARSLLDRGVDLVTVQQLMGHRRVDSTARYTRLAIWLPSGTRKKERKEVVGRSAEWHNDQNLAFPLGIIS